MEKVSGANFHVTHVRGYQALSFCRFSVYLKLLLAYGGSREGLGVRFDRFLGLSARSSLFRGVAEDSLHLC